MVACVLSLVHISSRSAGSAGLHQATGTNCTTPPRRARGDAAVGWRAAVTLPSQGCPSPPLGSVRGPAPSSPSPPQSTAAAIPLPRPPDGVCVLAATEPPPPPPPYECFSSPADTHYLSSPFAPCSAAHPHPPSLCRRPLAPPLPPCTLTLPSLPSPPPPPSPSWHLWWPRCSLPARHTAASRRCPPADGARRPSPAAWRDGGGATPPPPSPALPPSPPVRPAHFPVDAHR